MVLPSSIKSFRSDKRKAGREITLVSARMSLPKVITPAFPPSGTALLSLGLFLSQDSVKNFLLPRF